MQNLSSTPDLLNNLYSMKITLQQVLSNTPLLRRLPAPLPGSPVCVLH